MKRNYRNKGQMRVIEAILASFIIIAALSFVNFFATNPTSQRYETTELDKLGYNTLHDLDMQGILARFVYSQQWKNLEAALGVTLPLDVYYNMSVLDLGGLYINNVPISYGYSETIENSALVSTITYALVGYPTDSQSEYNPRILVLQLIRG